eukprot:365393-Chlamydomonas_euryale.AAC.2
MGRLKNNKVMIAGGIVATLCTMAYIPSKPSEWTSAHGHSTHGHSAWTQLVGTVHGQSVRAQHIGTPHGHTAWAHRMGRTYEHSAWSQQVGMDTAHTYSACSMDEQVHTCTYWTCKCIDHAHWPRTLAMLYLKYVCCWLRCCRKPTHSVGS